MSAVVRIVLLASILSAGLAARAPSAQAHHFPFIVPATGPIVSDYGDCRDDCRRIHLGYDIEDEIGVPIYAAASGFAESVVRTRVCPSIGSSAGNQVGITHLGDRYRTVYLHLETVLVENGQFVERGQQIGTMGNVGSLACLEPPHLHFEVRELGVPLNLNDVMPTGTDVTAGHLIPRHFEYGSWPDTVVDDQAAALYGDGRMGVVTRATGGAVWYAAQNAVGSDSWSAWQSLSGVTTSNPVVAQNLDSRLQVFARGVDNGIWTIQQLTPAGPWSGWTPVRTPGTFNGDPVVARSLDGRLHVFGRSPAGGVWVSVQSSPNGSQWSPWRSLGGIATSRLSIVLNGGGGLEVFVRGADGALWHAWQASADSWSSWARLGGVLSGAPGVVANADGRLEVAVRGGNQALYQRHQVSPGGAWTDWEARHGILRTDPQIARNADGRLEVFAVGGDFGVYHIWQTSPGGPGWSNWSALGGRVGSIPEVHFNADGRLALIVRADGSFGSGIFYSAQTAPGGPSWSTWRRV